MSREYALISNAEPNDFENSILQFLRDWPGERPPKSYVILGIPESGDADDAGAVLYTWQTTMDDMLRAKGHLELQIQHEALLENLGAYFHAAAEEGLLPCQLDAEDDEAEGGDEA